MAGRNIGHVEFIVDFDGDHLPRQAREIGRRAGREMGDGIDEGSDKQLSEFGTRLRKDMEKNGRLGGKSFTDAFEDSINRNLDDTVREVADVFSKEGGFDEFASSFDDIGDASDDLDRKLERLHSTGQITDDQFLDMIDTQTKFVARTRQAAEENERLEKAVQNIQLDRLAQQMDDVAEKRRLDTLETERQVRENKELEKVVNKIRFDRFQEELNLTRLGHMRASSAAKFAAKEEAAEAAAIERATDGHRKFNREGDRSAGVLERLGGKIRGMNFSFRQMPYIFKQIAGYTALFTALAPGIATLGSVTGSGLIGLSVGAGALGIAIAALIPGFKGMLDDVEKLPPKARAAAQSLQDFATPLGEMQDIIQEQMFDDLSGGLDRLRTKTLPRITKGMGSTAKTLNGIFDDTLDRLSSPRALQRIDRIFSGLQPTLKSLGGTLLNLGAGFSTVFEAGLDSGKGFASFLETVTGDFNDWTNSDPGQMALSKWFDHLDEIMPKIGRLIGSAGKSVSNLVTDKAVKNFGLFVDTMSDALPAVTKPLGDLVDTIDPLGLAAKAIQTLGQVLPPVLEDIGQGFDNLNTPELKKSVETNLPKLVDALGDVADIVPAVGDFLGAVLPDAIELVGDTAKTAAPPVQLLAAGLEAITGDAEQAGKTLDKIDWDGFKKGLDGVNGALGTNAGISIQKMLGIPDNAVDLSKEEGKKNVGAFLEGLGSGFAGGQLFTNLGKALQGDKGGDTIFSEAGRQKSVSFLEGFKNFSGLSGLLNPIIDALGGEDVKTAGDDAANDFMSGLVEGLRVVPGGNLIADLLQSMLGKDKDPVRAKGKSAADDFMSGLADGLRVIPGGGLVADLIQKGLDDNGKAKEKGKEAGAEFGEGVGEGLPTAGEKFDELFGGDAGKGAASGAGKGAGKAYGDGVKEGIGGESIADQFSDLLFGGADTAASGAGTQAGTSFKLGLSSSMSTAGGSVALASTNISNQMVTPFAAVPGRITTNLAPTPGAVNGVMGQLNGQPGADNVANPFGAVPGRITGQLAPAPGAVGGVMGQITGQPGADRTVSPFGAVPGRITGQISGAPGAVGGVMGQIDGAPGANNIVTPFGGVPGRVRGQVGGTPGAVQGSLGGISDFGAAARIVSPFNGVPGLIRSALSGIGGIVSGALSGARTALSIGIAGIRAAASNAHASGTITSGPEVALIGEAGPEAVVPLNRPLSRVDPRVRGISAILQGKADLPTGGGGYGTYVAEGAIQVVAPNSDPRLVAAATVDRMVAAAIR